MSFSKGDRFGESRGGTQTFSTYAEYIRQQFLISNNLMSRSGDRLDGFGPASPLRQKPKKNSKQQQNSPVPSSPKSIIDSPDTPPYLNTKQDHIIDVYRTKYNRADAPETTDSPPQSPSKKKAARSWSGSKAGRVVPLKVDTTSGSSNPFGEKPPGPATYHQNSTLVKPSFNRLLNEPSMDTTGEHPRMRPISAGANTGAIKSVYRASDNRHNTTFGGKSTGSLLPQRNMNRSTSAPPGGRSPLSPSRSSRVMPEWMVKSVSDSNPALKHPRYPPTSDKIMRRWSTVSRDSYVNFFSPDNKRPKSGRTRGNI